MNPFTVHGLSLTFGMELRTLKLMDPKTAKLKRRLDNLYKAFDVAYLSSDPLEFVHRYSRSEDREIVGLIASCLAYGRVAGIKKSVEKVLDVLGPWPARYVAGFTPTKGRARFSGFTHRFNKGEDVSCLLYFARQMFETSGGIGNFFLKGYSANHENIRPSLAAFSSNALSLDCSDIYGQRGLPDHAGVRFFFPSPDNGSPCKRLNLYLRWMVRRSDALDFGIWQEVDPAKLIIPLDTHVARIAKNIGLTSRGNPDWKMAEEVTGCLKELDARDPIKYDFALCRLGILDKCPKRLDLVRCKSCLIRELCVL